MSGCCDSEQKLPSCSHGLIGYCVKCETEQWGQIRAIKALVLDEVGHLKKLINAQDELYVRSCNRISELEASYEAKKDNRQDLNRALCEIQNEYKEMISSVNSQITELFFKVNDLYQIRKNMDFKKPHKCPVCEGEGKIIINNGQLLTSNPPQYPKKVCLSCQGSGIIWG